MNDAESEHGVSWGILDDSVTLTVTPGDDGGMLVRFTDEDDDLIYSSPPRERGFWRSRTTIGEIGNELADRVPQSKAEVKDELAKVWDELRTNAEEYEQELVDPSASELIEHTDRVEVHGGPESKIDVVITARPYGKPREGAENDSRTVTRRLTFTSAEWVRDDGDVQKPAVVRKYHNTFYYTLDINWEQWREDIRPAWQEMQEIVTDDHQTTAERLAMSTVRALRGRLDVHAEKSRIVNDTWNGWWDDSGDETTVWVPGDTLVEILDENSRDGDYLGALSRAAKEEGFTSGGRKQTSIDGNPINLYPFPAEVLGVQEIDVIGLETDDDGDGEGELSGGDDDDGGGGPDSPDAPDAPESADSPESADDVEDGAGDASVETVIKAANDMDSDGTGVDEETLVAEVSDQQGIPPDEAASMVEEGVVSGEMYRPEGEDTIALRPGGGDPPGRDELPLEAEGVPEP